MRATWWPASFHLAHDLHGVQANGQVEFMCAKTSINCRKTLLPLFAVSVREAAAGHSHPVVVALG